MENSSQSSKVVMVHSYKGGTGKTAIAVNLARFLALKLQKKVLLVEQDIGGSSFKNIFHIQPKAFWNDFYLNQRSLKDLIIKTDDFDIICAKEQEISLPEGYGGSFKTFYASQMERFKREIRYLSNKYDFIILDTRPGYSIDLINSIAASEVVFLISRLDTDNIETTIEMYDNIYSHFQSKKIFIVQNQVPQIINNIPTEKLDSDILKSRNNWNTFIQDKKIVSIPLKNEIAYPLSNSKLLPLDNIFISYINQLSDLII